MRTAQERSDSARAGGNTVAALYGPAHMRAIGKLARRGRLRQPRIGDDAGATRRNEKATARTVAPYGHPKEGSQDQ